MNNQNLQNIQLIKKITKQQTNKWPQIDPNTIESQMLLWYFSKQEEYLKESQEQISHFVNHIKNAAKQKCVIEHKKELKNIIAEGILRGRNWLTTEDANQLLKWYYNPPEGKTLPQKYVNAIETHLNQANPTHQQIIQLWYTTDLTHQEIADLLGETKSKSQKTVQNFKETWISKYYGLPERNQ